MFIIAIYCILAESVRFLKNTIAEHYRVRLIIFAEMTGFEPARAFTLLAFQASALDHYATSPTYIEL